MNIREETEVALKDAYWAEVRKLYDAYLHAIIIAQDKEPQVEAAAERYRKSLCQAQSALARCQQIARDVCEDEKK